MDDTPTDHLTIELTRAEWVDVVASVELLPHHPDQDLPGLTALRDALAMAGVE